MEQLMEIKTDELYKTEGGAIIPIITGVITAVRLGYVVYESAKDYAGEKGVEDAYKDMGMTN